MTKRVGRPMTGLVALCSVLLLLPAPAVAAPAPDLVPGGFASWSELFAMQQRLNRAADEIESVASMVQPDGLGGFWAAPERRELVVYWRGAVPPAVERAIAAHRADIPIAVLPAKYSRRQLVAEVQRITAESKAAGLAVSLVHPEHDGNGVRLVLVGKAATAAVAAKRDRVLARRAVDVEVRDGGAPPVQVSRQNDSSPYYAGARTSNCTLGFAVWHNFANSLLSAAHCVPRAGVNVNEDPAHNGGATVAIGPVQVHDVGRDIMIILANSAGRTWDGPYLSTYYKPVRGATSSRVGNFLCVSGSRSGVNCGAQVTQVDAAAGAYPVVVAQNLSGGQVAGNGDSGGPVFELPWPDDGSVIAKGVLLGMFGPRQCAIGEPGIPNRQCSDTVYYADIVQTLDAYDAKILTDWQNRGGQRRSSSLSGDTSAELIGVNNNNDGLLNVWRNGGDAAWIGPTTGIGSGWWNRSTVRFADLDGDGKDDAIGVNTAGDGVMKAWRNIDGMNGVWDGPWTIGYGWTNPAIARFADIDGDGRDDLIGVNPTGNGDALAFRNNGRAFQAWPWSAAAVIGRGWTGDPARFQFGDINGDGYDDLLGVDNLGNDLITAYPNNGSVGAWNWGAWPWSSTTHTIGYGVTNPSLIRFADINGDGYDDLISVNDAGDGVMHAWRNNRAAWGWPWGPRGDIGWGWWNADWAQFA